MVDELKHLKLCSFSSLIILFKGGRTRRCQTYIKRGITTYLKLSEPGLVIRQLLSEPKKCISISSHSADESIS